MGVFVTSIQFAGVNSEFSCKEKSNEGTIQEWTMLAPEAVMLNAGAGVDCEGDQATQYEDFAA